MIRKDWIEYTDPILDEWVCVPVKPGTCPDNETAAQTAQRIIRKRRGLTSTQPVRLMVHDYSTGVIDF